MVAAKSRTVSTSANLSMGIETSNRSSSAMTKFMTARESSPRSRAMLVSGLMSCAVCDSMPIMSTIASRITFCWVMLRF